MTSRSKLFLKHDTSIVKQIHLFLYKSGCMESLIRPQYVNRGTQYRSQIRGSFRPEFGEVLTLLDLEEYFIIGIQQGITHSGLAEFFLRNFNHSMTG